METKYYVYAHYKPNEENIPFYIGKGHAHRAYDKNNRNPFWKRVVKKYGYTVRILHENLCESDAFWIEIKLIAMYGRADLGRGPLTNLTDGGEGPSGLDGTASSIRLTEFHKTHNNINFGKIWITDKITGISSMISGDSVIPETHTKGRNIIKGLVSGKFIKSNEQDFISRKHKLIERCCIYCGKIGRGPNMTRFHFDNCSKAPILMPRKSMVYKHRICPHCNLSGTGAGMSRYHFTACRDWKPILAD